MRHLKKGFTLIELVVVIAVIAVLSAISVVSYVSVTKKAKETKALVEARQAWSELATEYLTYNDFISSGDEAYGWHYDYISDVAKFDIDDFTVTYNGREFKINPLEISANSAFDEITTSTVNLNDVTIGAAPFGLKLSYYNSIYSRGFSWATETSITESTLYVVESNQGESANFSSATPIIGSNATSGGIMTHKAFVENLSPSKTYSYKVGSSNGWSYGVFRTASNNPSSITAIQISDAQTKDPNKLNVWENTFAQAIETAGRKLNMVIYNGDQNQANSNSSYSNQIDFEAAIETIKPYLGSTPYMSVAGNHDYSFYTETTCIDFSNELGSEDNDMYYSYDYGNAHFIVLNTNRVPGLGKRNMFSITETTVPNTGFIVDSTLVAQAEWLVNDLESINHNKTKWTIVTMHAGVHSTGDHSSEDQIRIINESFAPIFSAYHVDFVMQAHDHTYCKTYPYKWDTAGHTTTSNNADIVNYNLAQTVVDGKTYDLNPRGTYYVTTGAAGHRTGEAEGKDGVYADLIHGTMNPVAPSKTFTSNFYKTEVSRITQSNSYDSFTTIENYYVDQTFNVGEYAAGNVNANMFGILNLDSTKLTYDVYTVRGNEVRLFDTLNVMKTL